MVWSVQAIVYFIDKQSHPEILFPGDIASIIKHNLGKLPGRVNIIIFLSNIDIRKLNIMVLQYNPWFAGYEQKWELKGVY